MNNREDTSYLGLEHNLKEHSRLINNFIEFMIRDFGKSEDQMIEDRYDFEKTDIRDSWNSLIVITGFIFGLPLDSSDVKYQLSSLDKNGLYVAIIKFLLDLEKDKNYNYHKYTK